MATGVWLAALAAAANAQFFGSTQGPDTFTLRPPRDVPSVPPGPAQSLIPPSGNVAPSAAPKGPLLQSLPANPGAQAHAAVSVPIVPAGQGAFAVSARFGHDLPPINGGLHWRVYRTEQNGVPRLVKEDKGAAPTFVLPPGAYVVSVGFGLANVTKAVQVRAETMKDVFEIPAGGLRIEGRVGDARIPQGQISFDLYKGSQFEPGDKRPIASAIMTGDIVLLPEGAYHIVSNYGDANATVRSDIRVEVGKLTDATINHRAAIITLKLVNERGGEARADTQWSVLTPGGDVVKESIGAFPRVILAEGEYRAIARNDNRTYESEFRVVAGVDREVEV
ncbi:MAG TPA: hypothetical protein VFV12_05540, partial [Xanthobacteraceae bacterium]|nr:hypothetical protein [Xanthobacteraceae bacterium]